MAMIDLEALIPFIDRTSTVSNIFTPVRMKKVLGFDPRSGANGKRYEALGLQND